MNHTDKQNLVFTAADTSYRRLKLCGSDVLDLLNRLCASELNLNLNGTPQHGLFTDERGRFLAIFTIAMLKSDEFLLICYAENSKPLQDHIAKYTIIEDVQLSDCSQEWQQISIIGNLTQPTIQKFTQLGCIVTDSPFKPTIALTEIVFEREIHAKVLKIIEQQRFEIADTERFEQIRVWHGWQAVGRELTDAVNPLEAGLKHLISFTKGCYIGQEVIARLDTYDKVQRQITAFSSQTQLKTGDPLENDAGIFGWVSSCVQHKDYFVGLGYTKKKLYQAGAPLKSAKNELHYRDLTNS